MVEFAATSRWKAANEMEQSFCGFYVLMEDLYVYEMPLRLRKENIKRWSYAFKRRLMKKTSDAYSFLADLTSAYNRLLKAEKRNIQCSHKQNFEVVLPKLSRSQKDA